MKEAIIMGGGPAGLSAAYRLQNNNVHSIICEADSNVGGISKTVEYKGYYFDLGGHRFFTKFDEVNDLWREVLGGKFKKTPRLSRIYYKDRYFNYPLTPANALFGVGLKDTFLIMSSYVNSRVFPYEKEETFEEWVSNRFGKKLYSIFFKTYTEKVWGIPCCEIQAEWAAQRIKGLSLATAVKNALIKQNNSGIKTLINEFDYPEYGPGMMYNEMRYKVEKAGGTVQMNARVSKVKHDGSRVKSIEYTDREGTKRKIDGTDFVSSIPVTELIRIFDPQPDRAVIDAAEALCYRSVITVDIIVDKEEVFPDNWIYIHSPEVRLGRIQNFKNWSPSMVPEASKTSLGLEYFCTENDDLWNKRDEEIFDIAADEVERIRICKRSDIKDYIIVRVPKAYPVYSTGYKKNVDIIRRYLDRFGNLHLVGRYGLFKYNNMDHSIMTGLYAAQNILEDRRIFDTWDINTDEEYHEEKSERSVKH